MRFFVTQRELDRVKLHYETRLLDLAVAVDNHLAHLRKQLKQLEKQMSEQSTALAASIKKLQDQTALLKADNESMLALVLDLRSALATAIEGGQLITAAELQQAVASIDSVTADLSTATTNDDAILNPKAPTAPVDPSAPAPSSSAPNAGDPTGATGVDHTSPVPGSTDDGSAQAMPTTNTPIDGVDHTDPGSPAPGQDSGQVQTTVADGSASPGAGSQGAGTDNGTGQPGAPENAGAHVGSNDSTVTIIPATTDSDGNTIDPATTVTTTKTPTGT